MHRPPTAGSIYTDQKCEALGATDRRARPRARCGAGRGIAATGTRLYRGGCARTLQDLVFEITAAIDAQDANRLSGLYHWVGMSGSGGQRGDGSAGRDRAAAAGRHRAGLARARRPTRRSSPARPRCRARRRAARRSALRLEQTLANGSTPSQHGARPAAPLRAAGGSACRPSGRRATGAPFPRQSRLRPHDPRMQLPRMDLAQRRDQALGRRHHARHVARAALRLVGVRGHPQLRDAATARRSSASPTTPGACSPRRRSTTWRSRTRSTSINAACRDGAQGERPRQGLPAPGRVPRPRRLRPVGRHADRRRGRGLADGRRTSATACSSRASTPACRAGSASRPTPSPPAPRPAAITCPASWSRAKRAASASAKASRWRRPACSAKAPARTCSWCSTARCTPRRSAPRCSTASPATRSSRLARDDGIEVVERDLPREYLYLCDELFMCGTAAEITPIRSVDGRQVGAGKRGPADAAHAGAVLRPVRRHARRTSTAGSNRCNADCCTRVGGLDPACTPAQRCAERERRHHAALVARAPRARPSRTARTGGARSTGRCRRPANARRGCRDSRARTGARRLPA